MNDYKTCTGCLKSKPKSEFGKYAITADGLQRRCKECKTERYRVYARNYRDRHRERERLRWRLKERVKANRKRYANHAVTQKLRNAVIAGKVIKPTLCQACGSSGPIQGHHFDYSKPFDVEWLCSRCHGIRHQKPVRAAQRALQGGGGGG